MGSKTVLAIIVSVLQQVTLKPQMPESVWPVSIAGWVAIITGLAGWIVALRKANNEPILKKIEELEEKATGAVQQLEKDMTARLNGFGRRVGDLREDLTRLDSAISDNAERMIRSEEDRKQLNARISAQEGKSDATIIMIQGIERGLREKIEQQGEKYSEAMHKQGERFAQALDRQTDKMMAALTERSGRRLG